MLSLFKALLKRLLLSSIQHIMYLIPIDGLWFYSVEKFMTCSCQIDPLK